MQTLTKTVLYFQVLVNKSMPVITRDPLEAGAQGNIKQTLSCFKKTLSCSQVVVYK